MCCASLFPGKEFRYLYSISLGERRGLCDISLSLRASAGQILSVLNICTLLGVLLSRNNSKISKYFLVLYRLSLLTKFYCKNLKTFVTAFIDISINIIIGRIYKVFTIQREKD